MATHPPVGKGQRGHPDEIAAAHARPPAATAAAAAASHQCATPATLRTTSATASPKSGPATKGSPPVNWNSPSTRAPSAPVATPASTARTDRTAGSVGDAVDGHGPVGIRRRVLGYPPAVAAPGETSSATQPTEDWPARIADTVEHGVALVRDRTTAPLVQAARFVVYGLVAGVLGTAALVLVAIGIVRLLDVLVPAEVWAAHLITGGIFALVGLLLWSRRTAGRS